MQYRLRKLPASNWPITDVSRRLFIGGGLAFAAGCSRSLPALASDRRAVPARKFFESVGICTHPNWRSRLWGSANWEDAFLETGVLHTRGKLGSRAIGQSALGDLRRLFDRGVKICVTVADQDEGLDRQATKANIDFLANYVGAENISGIESANEYNNPRKRPGDWASELRDFQKWLHDTVRGNPRLAGVPLVAPSMWGRRTEDYIELGNLEPNVDKGCLHYYTGGRKPTRAGRPRTDDEGGGAGQYALIDAIRDAKVIAPNKPLWVTEYGYPIAGPGLSPRGNFISETAAAKYLIRGLFDLFAEEVERTYVYVLIDDVHRSPPRYHGLMDGTLRPRQSFHAVKNLMALFADMGRARARAELDYSVSPAAGSVKRQLFQKSDGTFLLAMYQDVDSFDRVAGADIPVAAINVGLLLGRPARRIEVFIPAETKAAALSVANVKTVTVPVGDQVTVVKITPS